MIKVLKQDARIDKNNVGGCFLKLEINGKRVKVNATLHKNGEVKIYNPGRFDEKTLAKITELVNQAFKSAKRHEEEDSASLKTFKGYPKCQKCGSYHPFQDPCSDWVL